MFEEENEDIDLKKKISLMPKKEIKRLHARTIFEDNLTLQDKNTLIEEISLIEKARTYKQKYQKWPDWFRAWQRKFYKSKRWLDLANRIRIDRQMISDVDGELILGKSIVDHIVEITPYNYQDENITLNPNNLQLMSLAQHNTKTFKGVKKIDNRDTRTVAQQMEEREYGKF